MTFRFLFFYFLISFTALAQLPRVYLQGEIPSKIRIPDSLQKESFVEVVHTNASGEVRKGIANAKGKLVFPVVADTLVWLDAERGVITGRPVGDGWAFGLRNLKGAYILDEGYERIRAGKFLLIAEPKLAYKSPANDAYRIFDYTGKLQAIPVVDSAKILVNGDLIVYQDFAGSVFRKSTTPLYSNIKSVLPENTTEKLLQYPSWMCDSAKSVLVYADSIAVLNDSLVKVKRRNKWALYNKDSKQKLPFVFDSLSLYKGEFLKSETGEGQRIWSLDGVGVTPYCDSVWLDNKGYFHLLFKNKGWKLSSISGKFISDTAYAEIGLLSNALLAVRKDSLWGYLHDSGKWQIAPKYKKASDFRYGYALVEIANNAAMRYALIDRNDSICYRNQEAVMYYYGMMRYRYCRDSLYEGEPRSELYYAFPPYRYEDIRPWIPGYFTTHNGELTGVVNSVGKEIVYCHQDTLFVPTPKDSIFFYKRKNGSIGISDQYGNRTLYTTFKFFEVRAFHNGLARYKDNGLFGFLDRYGNTVISPQYTTIGEYSGDHVPVVLKGKWGYLDRSEKLKIQPYYNEALPVKNGLAIVRQNKKWEFLNTDGKKINVTSYDKFTPLPSGKYLVYKGKKVGLTDISGREIVFPKYNAIYELSDTTFAVQRDGYYGVLDRQENILINFKHAGIVFDSFNRCYYIKSESTLIPLSNDVP